MEDQFSPVDAGPHRPGDPIDPRQVGLLRHLLCDAIGGTTRNRITPIGCGILAKEDRASIVQFTGPGVARQAALAQYPLVNAPAASVYSRGVGVIRGHAAAFAGGSLVAVNADWQAMSGLIMTKTSFEKHPCPAWRSRRGKVRDIYDLGDRLLLVSTDRISAFDWVLPTAIPDKGRVLTQIAAFWFELLGEPNHLITTDVEQMDLPAGRGPSPCWPAARRSAARPRSCRSSASSAAIWPARAGRNTSRAARSAASSCRPG